MVKLLLSPSSPLSLHSLQLHHYGCWWIPLFPSHKSGQERTIDILHTVCVTSLVLEFLRCVHLAVYPTIIPFSMVFSSSLQIPLQSLSPSQLPSPLPTPLSTYYKCSPSQLRTNHVYSKSLTPSYIQSHLPSPKKSQNAMTAPSSIPVSISTIPILTNTILANRIDDSTPTPSLPPMKNSVVDEIL